MSKAKKILYGQFPIEFLFILLTKNNYIMLHFLTKRQCLAEP